MPLDLPLTLISPLRAGRGNSSDTRLPSLVRKRRAAAPDGSLSLSERERVRAKVRFDSIETAKRLVLLLSFELCSWNFATQAAAPTLDHFYPIAVQIGSTNAVSAIGKFDPWPPKVWVDAPGIEFKTETNTGMFT